MEDWPATHHALNSRGQKDLTGNGSSGMLRSLQMWRGEAVRETGRRAPPVREKKRHMRKPVRCCLYRLVLLDVMLVFAACQPPVPPLPPPAPLVLHMGPPQDRYDHNRTRRIVSPALREGRPTRVIEEVYTPGGHEAFPSARYEPWRTACLRPYWCPYSPGSRCLSPTLLTATAAATATTSSTFWRRDQTRNGASRRATRWATTWRSRR